MHRKDYTTPGGKRKTFSSLRPKKARGAPARHIFVTSEGFCDMLLEKARTVPKAESEEHNGD
jgi:hypothetical protein